MFLTKIYFPVRNLDNGDFDYGKEISTDELIRLQDEQFRRTDASISRYVHGYGKDVNGGRVFELRQKKAVLDEVNALPMECAILGMNEGDELDNDFFLDKRNSGKMFIIRININPTVLSSDGESELKFWVDDSDKLLKDPVIDKNTKLKHLPTRDLGIDIGTQRLTLQRCKIIENKSSKNFPYYFAVIVEKIK